VEKAKKVVSLDNVVDGLYDQVFRELITFMMVDPKTIDRATRLIWVAHNLERAADAPPTSASGWSSWSPARWRKSGFQVLAPWLGSRRLVLKVARVVQQKQAVSLRSQLQDSDGSRRLPQARHLTQVDAQGLANHDQVGQKVGDHHHCPIDVPLQHAVDSPGGPLLKVLQ